jgi:hypothetical protein
MKKKFFTGINLKTGGVFQFKISNLKNLSEKFLDDFLFISSDKKTKDDFLSNFEKNLGAKKFLLKKAEEEGILEKFKRNFEKNTQFEKPAKQRGEKNEKNKFDDGLSIKNWLEGVEKELNKEDCEFLISKLIEKTNKKEKRF